MLLKVKCIAGDCPKEATVGKYCRPHAHYKTMKKLGDNIFLLKNR